MTESLTLNQYAGTIGKYLSRHIAKADLLPGQARLVQECFLKAVSETNLVVMGLRPPDPVPETPGQVPEPTNGVLV